MSNITEADKTKSTLAAAEDISVFPHCIFTPGDLNSIYKETILKAREFLINPDNIKKMLICGNLDFVNTAEEFFNHYREKLSDLTEEIYATKTFEEFTNIDKLKDEGIYKAINLLKIINGNDIEAFEHKFLVDIQRRKDFNKSCKSLLVDYLLKKPEYFYSVIKEWYSIVHKERLIREELTEKEKLIERELTAEELISELRTNLNNFEKWNYVVNKAYPDSTKDVNTFLNEISSNFSQGARHKIVGDSMVIYMRVMNPDLQLTSLRESLTYKKGFTDGDVSKFRDNMLKFHEYDVDENIKKLTKEKCTPDKDLLSIIETDFKNPNGLIDYQKFSDKDLGKLNEKFFRDFLGLLNKYKPEYNAINLLNDLNNQLSKVGYDKIELLTKLFSKRSIYSNLKNKQWRNPTPLEKEFLNDCNALLNSQFDENALYNLLEIGLKQQAQSFFLTEIFSLFKRYSLTQDFLIGLVKAIEKGDNYKTYLGKISNDLDNKSLIDLIKKSYPNIKNNTDVKPMLISAFSIEKFRSILWLTGFYNKFYGFAIEKDYKKDFDEVYGFFNKKMSNITNTLIKHILVTNEANVWQLLPDDGSPSFKDIKNNLEDLDKEIGLGNTFFDLLEKPLRFLSSLESIINTELGTVLLADKAVSEVNIDEEGKKDLLDNYLKLAEGIVKKSPESFRNKLADIKDKEIKLRTGLNDILTNLNMTDKYDTIYNILLFPENSEEYKNKIKSISNITNPDALIAKMEKEGIFKLAEEVIVLSETPQSSENNAFFQDVYDGMQKIKHELVTKRLKSETKRFLLLDYLKKVKDKTESFDFERFMNQYNSLWQEVEKENHDSFEGFEESFIKKLEKTDFINAKIYEFLMKDEFPEDDLSDLSRAGMNIFCQRTTYMQFKLGESFKFVQNQINNKIRELTGESESKVNSYGFKYNPDPNMFEKEEEMPKETTEEVGYVPIFDEEESRGIKGKVTNALTTAKDKFKKWNPFKNKENDPYGFFR